MDATNFLEMDFLDVDAVDRLAENVVEATRRPKAVDRRRALNGERKFQIKELWNLHHEILRLAVLGVKPVEIAKQLSITSATVSNCLNSEVSKRQLEVMRNARDKEAVDIAIEIRNLAPKAIKLLDEVMSDPNQQTKNRLDVAFDLLDRAGYAPPKVVIGHMNHYLTADDIQDIKKRARESDIVIDIQIPQANEVSR